MNVFDNTILVAVEPDPFVHVLVVAIPLSSPLELEVSFSNSTCPSSTAVVSVPIAIVSHAFVKAPVHAPVLVYSPLPACDVPAVSYTHLTLPTKA